MKASTPGDGPAVPLPRRLLAELVGSGMLTAVVVGSGITAERLLPGVPGQQLAANAAATAVGLFAVVLAVGPVSGAHLNPVVTLVDAWFGGQPGRHAIAYLPAQFAGCACGAVLADLMFGRAPLTLSTHDRVTGPHLLAEVVATAGLVLVVFALVRGGRAPAVPAAVGAYIAAAYWFTSSTSFANPAITAARALTDTFAGIAPASVPAFVVAQAVGGAVGAVLILLLYPDPDPPAAGAPAQAPSKPEAEAQAAA